MESVIDILESKFGAKRDEKAKWDACVVVPKEYLHNAVEFLKNDPSMQFDMLLDLAGIDYLTYPNYEGPRFAISYAFKCTKKPGVRVRLKVLVSEADLKVPTITDLYASANWLEREVFDQYGIVFAGHPDLRRILNHLFKAAVHKADFMDAGHDGFAIEGSQQAHAMVSRRMRRAHVQGHQVYFFAIRVKYDHSLILPSRYSSSTGMISLERWTIL